MEQNKDILKQSLILAAQVAHEEFKGAAHRQIDSLFISNEGAICRLGDAEEIDDNVNKAKEKLGRCLVELFHFLNQEEIQNDSHRSYI